MNQTQVFSGLEDQYQKYRPRYPFQILDSLRAYVESGRNDSWPPRPLLVDIGAATGNLTRQLRDGFGAEWRYFGVEPGNSMRRRAAVRHLHPPLRGTLSRRRPLHNRREFDQR